MNVAAILTEIERNGISLAVCDGGLRVEAPKGALTEDLRRALSEHKAELLRVLGASSEDLERFRDLVDRARRGDLPGGPVDLGPGVRCGDPRRRILAAVNTIEAIDRDKKKRESRLWQLVRAARLETLQTLAEWYAATATAKETTNHVNGKNGITGHGAD